MAEGAGAHDHDTHPHHVEIQHVRRQYTDRMSSDTKLLMQDVQDLVDSARRRPPCQTVRAALRKPLAVFFLLLGCGGATWGVTNTVLGEGNWKENYRKDVRQEAFPYAQGLQLQVRISTSGAYAVGAIVGTHPDLANLALATSNFNSIAQTLIDTYGGITNLQLAPCGIVRRVHPIEGNEAVIGHNLLKDGDRVTYAIDTIVNRRMTFIGPLTLLQGGVAIIGRYPVYSDGNNSGCIDNYHGVAGVPSDFWGYSTVLIRIEDLMGPINLRAALYDALDLDYEVTAVWKGAEVFVEGSRGEGGLGGDTEDLAIQIKDPGGTAKVSTWTMRVKPRGGWPLFSTLFWWKIAVVAISFSAGLFSWYNVQASKFVLGALSVKRERLTRDLQARLDQLEEELRLQQAR